MDRKLNKKDIKNGSKVGLVFALCLSGMLLFNNKNTWPFLFIVFPVCILAGISESWKQRQNYQMQYERIKKEILNHIDKEQ